MQGQGKSLKNICSNYGIQSYFNRTLNEYPCVTHRSGIIYWYMSQAFDCDDEYTRESTRQFGKRFKEYLKEPSPIHNPPFQHLPPTPLENLA